MDANLSPQTYLSWLEEAHPEWFAMMKAGLLEFGGSLYACLPDCVPVSGKFLSI